MADNVNIDARIDALASFLPNGMIYRIAVSGEARRFLYVSSSVNGIFGVSAEAAVADANNLYGRIDPAYLPTLLQEEQTSIASGEAFQTEVEFRRPDGSLGWLRITSKPIVSPGAIIWEGLASDITEEKAAARNKAQADYRLEIALQAAGIGLWEWEVPSNRFTFSPRALDIFGLAPSADVTFDSLREIIHPEDLPEVLRLSGRALDPAIRGNDPYRYRIRTPAGETRWILARGGAVFERIGGEETAVRYIGTFQDVTAEHLAEQKAADTAARLQLAIEASGIALWELDVLADQLKPNPQLNVLYGFPPDAQPTTDEFRSRYAPGERERLERAGQQAAARGENLLQEEVHHVWPDGTEKWLLIRAQGVPRKDGSGLDAIGVAMDITHRKLAEQKAATVARELQHRFKNMLSVIQSLAVRTLGKSGVQREAMDAFIGRLQALGWASDSVFRNEGTEGELSDLVEAITRPYQDPGVERFRVTGPQARIDGKLAVDLGMALHELCTNALKYGALSVTGGTVAIDWQLEEDWLVLVWRESGGPAVVKPETEGFGSRLLHRGLFSGGRGNVATDFQPTGLECIIRIRKAPGDPA